MSAKDRKRVAKMLHDHGWKSDVEVMDLCEGELWTEGDVVDAALGSLVKKLPRVTKLLRGARHACAVHHPNDQGGAWLLAYLLGDDPDGRGMFLCGSPNPEANEAGGWKLPAPLRELYARHDGLGYPMFEHGWVGFDPGVMPASRVVVPEVPNHEDLLRFTRGWGEVGEGGWCFAGKRKLEIVDVEDRHGGRSDAVRFDFWGFLDRYLTGDTDELPEAERF